MYKRNCSQYKVASGIGNVQPAKDTVNEIIISLSERRNECFRCDGSSPRPLKPRGQIQMSLICNMALGSSCAADAIGMKK